MQLSLRSELSAMSLFLTFLLFASSVTSQGLPKLPGSNDNNASPTSGAPATAGSTKGSQQAETASVTGSSAPQSASASASNKATGTTTGEPSGTSSGSALPAITTESDAPGLTGLPKLAGDNYPPPSVPPTANAPFMQHSSLPEGTVFIAVGAVLGFIGMLVIAWRGLVAWSIHRSVKKAALAHSSKYAHGRDPRAGQPSKSAYLGPTAASTLTLDPLAASGKSARASRVPSAHNSLFFSPTASTGMQANANRGSSYLPAGYYAAGNQAPSGMTHIGGGVPMSNLTNIRDSKRYSRNNSPPGTPSLPPSRGGGPPDSPYNGRLSTQALVNQSSSSLNLNAPTQGRAPSAYLEDLFENHPPGTFPPEENVRESKRYSRF